MKRNGYAINNGKDNVALATVDVLINGEEKAIIPAFTKYSIKREDFSQRKLFEEVDKNKILPTLFAFTDTKPFRDEGVVLFDFNGEEIPQELDGNVFVYLDKPDTINLLDVLDTPLKAEMVECESVADAYCRVATTFAYSRCPTKDEWIGLGAATTNEDVLIQIFKFAKEHKMNGTAAQSYFGLSYRIPSLQRAAMTMTTLIEDDKFRTLEDATNLFEATEKAFGAKCAVQTRYIKALNTSINLSSLNEVVECLSVLDEATRQKITGARADERSQYIQDFISKHVKQREKKEVA